MNDAWVLLAECNDVAELHALRAALEARGVPCQVLGEHTHGIMGPIHGAMVRSRVLVPQPALALARQLAEDIVGPFDEATPRGADDDDDDPSPFRRAAEVAEDDADDDDDEREPEAPALRLKSHGRLILVALLVVAPLFGLAHVYAGKGLRAGVLALASLFAIPAALGGATWAMAVLGAVWIADLVGGAVGIAAHNRLVQAAAAKRSAPAIAAG